MAAKGAQRVKKKNEQEELMEWKFSFMKSILFALEGQRP